MNPGNSVIFWESTIKTICDIHGGSHITQEFVFIPCEAPEELLLAATHINATCTLISTCRELLVRLTKNTVGVKVRAHWSAADGTDGRSAWR